ncbi:hypothetical protein ACGFKZ_29455 [Micromonospora tulbaghiae]
MDRYWLGIAALLRIPPWELERLTYRQLLDAVDHVDEANRKAAEAAPT